MEFRTIVLSGLGLVGGTIATLMGGWDSALQTLVILMAIDYVTGLAVAGFFQRSTKTADGSLQSIASWKGLCRKGMTLLIVMLAARLDITIGTEFVRNAVIIGYIANEILSIIENAALMGVPLPEGLEKGLEILKNKFKGGNQ